MLSINTSLDIVGICVCFTYISCNSIGGISLRALSGMLCCDHMTGFLKEVLFLIWICQVIMRHAKEEGAPELKNHVLEGSKFQGGINVANMSSQKLKMVQVGMAL